MKDYRKIFKDVINWELWDKLVAQTKKDIAKQLKERKLTKKRPLYVNSYPIYCYNNNGKLVYTFPRLKDCVAYFKSNTTTIRKYASLKYIYKGFLLSKEELREDIAFAQFKLNIANGNIYRKKF